MLHLVTEQLIELEPNLIPSYVHSMCQRLCLSRKECLEYICGSNCLRKLSVNSDNNMHSCISKIINPVMSFTPFSQLIMENQETGVIDEIMNETYVFEKMIVKASFLLLQ